MSSLLKLNLLHSTLLRELNIIIIHIEAPFWKEHLSKKEMLHANENAAALSVI
jgi:hypothetical protein